MITDFHFLRPWFFTLLLPLVCLAVIRWHQKPRLQAWEEICDSHLLHRLVKQGSNRQTRFFGNLYLSALFMVISCTGPSWQKLPTPTYQFIQPRVLVLDLSEHMMAQDLTPNRISRAKFIIQDLLAQKGRGQFALVVFTDEAFVVSPLTDDGQTIASLLTTVSPDIMPINGQNLTNALTEAAQLIKSADYTQGQILVLTADSPSEEAIEMAKVLAQQNIFSSIVPMTADKNLNPLFQRFANQGAGQLLVYTGDTSNIQHWLRQKITTQSYTLNQDNDIPLWRDEGRWFLLPALLFLLPVFRRGWLQQARL